MACNYFHFFHINTKDKLEYGGMHLKAELLKFIVSLETFFKSKFNMKISSYLNISYA